MYTPHTHTHTYVTWTDITLLKSHRLITFPILKMKNPLLSKRSPRDFKNNIDYYVALG